MVWHSGWLQSQNVFLSHALAGTTNSQMGDQQGSRDEFLPAHIDTFSNQPYNPLQFKTY